MNVRRYALCLIPSCINWKLRNCEQTYTSEIKNKYFFFNKITFFSFIYFYLKVNKLQFLNNYFECIITFCLVLWNGSWGAWALRYSNSRCSWALNRATTAGLERKIFQIAWLTVYWLIYTYIISDQIQLFN